ncbi:hypothetical protein BAE44_0025462 [Dichanthelium oligosanthes]|uniref:Uncharacterized protein n=1 Tax=Dichanthelium oligosanthes TaxID=888268 RepID=A0A1E5UL13_9POAL|nr:hypothetical protein BAE44_0025462 [Dichanthelium oligosanthes]
MNPELSTAWDRDPKLKEQEQGGNQAGLLPPSIIKLEISNLTNNVQSRLLSCLPLITQLATWESPELTSLQLAYCTGEGMSSMVKLTEEHERVLQVLNSLQDLEFWDYPNLLSLPAANLQSLVSLKALNIISCPSISRLPEMATSCTLDVIDCSEELSKQYVEWKEWRREKMIDAETVN